jgi:arylsulfatase A-like enzyme
MTSTDTSHQIVLENPVVSYATQKALAMAAFTIAAVAAHGSFALAAKQPNIVFIMADDLGYGDLGCYGQKLIATPRIDRLASEGMRFTQAYAGGPVCTSSRSVLMTGMHTGHTPARDNVPHYDSYLEEDDITVAEILTDAGYRCGGVGKWSLGDAGTAGRATNQGFHNWFGYLNQDHAHYYFTEYLDDDDVRLELPGNTISREHYSHNLLTERALSFIRECRNQPFFLYAAFALPHFSAREEDNDGLAVPSTQPYSDRDWDEKSKKYAAMIHMLDRDVGRIIDLIEELGQTKNTLVIFTSDNGGHATIPARFQTSGLLRGFKRSLTEGGIRVPFITHWPGTVPAGTSSDDVIAFQDMLPTFAMLADAVVPHDLQIDGISIAAALKGEKQSQSRNHLYWDYGHCRGNQYVQAVRLGDWKGIRSAVTGHIQLYDLSRDIGEAKDVALTRPRIVDQIRRIMDQAVTPNPRYEIGTVYRGGPIWKKTP